MCKVICWMGPLLYQCHRCMYASYTTQLSYQFGAAQSFKLHLFIEQMFWDSLLLRKRSFKPPPPIHIIDHHPPTSHHQCHSIITHPTHLTCLHPHTPPPTHWPYINTHLPHLTNHKCHSIITHPPHLKCLHPPTRRPTHWPYINTHLPDLTNH